MWNREVEERFWRGAREGTFEWMRHLLVIHRVDGDGHVSRLVGTRVDVAVVLGKKVDVVEHVAVVIVEASRFVEADVHQHRAVELYFRLLEQPAHHLSFSSSRIGILLMVRFPHRLNGSHTMVYRALFRK